MWAQAVCTLLSKELMESKPISRPLPTEMYSRNLVCAPRSVWLYPAKTSSLMWNALSIIHVNLEAANLKQQSPLNPVKRLVC